MDTNEINAFLDSEEGQKLLQPRLDKYYSKGLESWKASNLSKLIDEEIAKRYPEETEEQKRLKKIENELNEQKRIAQIEMTKNKAIAKLNENKIPLELAELILADSDEGFNNKFNILKESWEKELNKRIDNEIKKEGREVHKDKKKSFNDDMNALIRGGLGKTIDNQ